jgi:hypothetical protein
MTLPTQLRAIADGIDAAEAARRAAIAQLAELAAGAYSIVDELGAALDADADEVMRDGSGMADSRIPTDAMADATPHPADGSAVLVAAEEHQPGEETVELGSSPAAPIEQAAPADRRAPPTAVRRQPTVSPAPPGTPDPWQRPYRVKTMQCPECDFRALDAAGLGSHRRHRHGVAGTSRGATEGQTSATNGNTPTVLRKGVETSIEEPTERRWPKRPTIAERVAARDAGRTRRDARKAARA